MDNLKFEFEEVGWSRIDTGPDAQSKIEDSLRRAGASIKTLDCSELATGYHAFRHLEEYAGEYQAYAGPLEHCFLEKSLEHYISLLLVHPAPGMVGIDVGSCQSVMPALGRRVYGVTYFEQDLTYPPGVHDERIGSSADAIPLPDESVDFMTLHCTFEHFEGDADTGFVRECGRLLKKGGRTVILPLYLSSRFCNVTGEKEVEPRKNIGFDGEADHYCLIPEWKNRFGRHYSPHALLERVLLPAIARGLSPQLYRISGWETIDKDLWMRWALVLERKDH